MTPAKVSSEFAARSSATNLVEPQRQTISGRSDRVDSFGPAGNRRDGKDAETEGFEPSEPLRVLHLSRVVHSTGLCDVSRNCLSHPSGTPRRAGRGDRSVGGGFRRVRTVMWCRPWCPGGSEGPHYEFPKRPALRPQARHEARGKESCRRRSSASFRGCRCAWAPCTARARSGSGQSNRSRSLRRPA